MLDRVFASVDWDSHFSMSSLTALPRVGSDHTPLMLDTAGRKSLSPKMFPFEKWWLSQPGFHQMMRETWSATSSFISSVDNWLSKTRLLRKKTKGWAINIESALRKRKKAPLMEFDPLDVLSESQ